MYVIILLSPISHKEVGFCAFTVLKKFINKGRSMLYYHITLLFVFMVLAYAVILLVKKITDIRKQRNAQQYKETAFLNKVVAEQGLKADRLSNPDELVQSHPPVDVVFRLEESDTELDRNKLRTLIFELIDSMTEEEMRQILKEFRERKFSKRR